MTYTFKFLSSELECDDWPLVYDLFLFISMIYDYLESLQKKDALIWNS